MTIRFLGYAGLGSALFALGLSAGVARAEEPRPDDAKPAKGVPAADVKPTDRTVVVANDAWVVYDRPALRYEQPRFTGDARLFVRTTKASKATDAANTPEAYSWRVYRGRDLDVITRANAELATHADMPGLRQHVTTSTKAAPASMHVTGAVRTSVEAPGLVYEPAPQGTSRLFVRDADGREAVYSGVDFESIVLANPSLEEVTGFPAFRERVTLVDAVRPWTLRNDSTTILNVTYQPTGVVVATNEWRDGQWLTHTHQGKSLAEIETAQPTLRALFDGGKDAPASPAPATQGAPAWQLETFGVTMATPPRCLDTQLNLAGRGVLVTTVVPGSSADLLGLRVDDVIVDYDGRPVADGEWLRSQLAASRSDSQAKVIVLRRGSRVTLSR